jgi:hypothetical protein
MSSSPLSNVTSLRETRGPTTIEKWRLTLCQPLITSCLTQRPPVQYPMESEPPPADPVKRFAPCICCEFNPGDWPYRDATLRIAPCMRQCPYCGDQFVGASKLRKHLLASTHKHQNLTIEREHSGRLPVK